MGYGLDYRISTPDRRKIFLYSITSRPVLGPSQSPTQWVPGALSPQVELLRREDDHLPSSAEVKICGAIPPLSRTLSWRRTGTNLPLTIFYEN
jgi:hypothetical protein